MQLLTAGSAACFADLVTFPLDTVKVRQQIQSSVAFSQVKMIFIVLRTLFTVNTLFRDPMACAPWSPGEGC